MTGPTGTRVLAIDLGGTSLRAATADISRIAEIAMVGRWPAPVSATDFRDQVAALARAHGPVDGIGITIPGLVNETMARWVPNLPFLDGIDLSELFAETGAPIAAGNDAQIALLGEATVGAARGLDDAILLAIGTGIGSAVLSGGRIVRGGQGAACSFGFACADIDDEGDERLGWLERHAAGTALDGLAADAGFDDGAALIDAARTGDAAAMAGIDRAATALGTALAGAVALLDPEAILLAGGVSEATDVLAPAIGTVLKRHLPPHLRDIEIRAGAFGPRAALVGAAVAAAAGPEWWRMQS